MNTKSALLNATCLALHRAQVKDQKLCHCRYGEMIFIILVIHIYSELKMGFD